MASMCINTSDDSKKTLDTAVSTSSTDMPSVLESTMSLSSSLLKEFRLRVDTGTSQFYHSMAVGTGSKQTYQWTNGRHDAFSLQFTNGTDLWKEDVSKPSNLWDFYLTKAQTL